MNRLFPCPVSTGFSPAYRCLPILLAMLALSACGPKTAELRPEPAAIEDSAAAEDQKINQQQLKFEQGKNALAAGNYAQARRLFGEMIRANPGLSGPYANLALIDFKQKKYQAALKQVNRAIELNPSQAQAYHLRAQIRLQQGEIKKARDDYQQAIELNPKYLNAHYNLALLYDIYLQEIALAIDHYTIYLSLLGDRDEAIEEWINHLKGTLKNG